MTAIKTRMTKQRRFILERLKTAPLAWGYGEQGGKEYFFTDGGHASARVVEGMLRAGLLRHEREAYGFVSQGIVSAVVTA